MEKLKPSLPGAMGHISENWDRYEGEMGHAIITVFTIRLIGEGISTIISKYQQIGNR